ncbi:hypothetical protein Tco_0082177, partial [Tanacetum coccineum]
VDPRTDCLQADPRTDRLIGGSADGSSICGSVDGSLSLGPKPTRDWALPRPVIDRFSQEAQVIMWPKPRDLVYPLYVITPIGEKIDKIERQICEGKLRLLDNDRNPLVLTGIVESDSEVEVIFDETANLRISTSDKDESDKVMSICDDLDITVRGRKKK